MKIITASHIITKVEAKIKTINQLNLDNLLVLNRLHSQSLKTSKKANEGNAKKQGGDKHNDAIDKHIKEQKEDPQVSNIRKNKLKLIKMGTKSVITALIFNTTKEESTIMLSMIIIQNK